MPIPDTVSKALDKNSEYLKLEGTVKWLFNNFGSDGSSAEFIKTEEKTFEGKTREYATFQSVQDLNSDGQPIKKYSTSSKNLLRKLYGMFDRGNFTLEITKSGEGFETDYDIYPLG